MQKRASGKIAPQVHWGQKPKARPRIGACFWLYSSLRN